MVNCIYVINYGNYDYRQGRRNDVKARGADFRERALLN
jgi:hypothetical protein